MLRFVGLGLVFSQYDIAWVQQQTVLLHLPSGTFGLQFRRDFCFNIKFAIHIQIPAAKWKITGKFSFLFRALLSCSSVYATGMRKKSCGGRKSIECTKPVTLLTEPLCPLFTQVFLSSPMAQKPQPSPSTLSPMRPPHTQGARHSDGPALTDSVNIHFLYNKGWDKTLSK